MADVPKTPDIGIIQAPIREMPPADANDVRAASRSQGHTWESIDQWHEQTEAGAAASGHNESEVQQFLRWSNPMPFEDHTSAEWDHRISATSDFRAALQSDKPISEEESQRLAGDMLRYDYADALKDGMVKSPGDFAAKYFGQLAGKFGDPDTGEPDDMVRQRVAELSAHTVPGLPTNQDATDFALALTHEAGVPLTPTTVARTKENLLDRWAASGQPLAQLYSSISTNPSQLAAVTMAMAGLPTIPPTVTDALGKMATAAKGGFMEEYNGLSEKYDTHYPFEYDRPGVLNQLKFLGALAAMDVGVAAKSIETVVRAPTAVLHGAFSASAELLREAGVVGKDVNTEDAFGKFMAEIGTPALIMLGMKEPTMRAPKMAVIDPLKKPAEAVQIVTGKEAVDAGAVDVKARELFDGAQKAGKSVVEYAEEQQKVEAVAARARGETVPAEAAEEQKAAVELAKGYEVGGAIFDHFYRLMANEEGSLKIAMDHLWYRFRYGSDWKDAVARRAEFEAARDFAQQTIRRYRGMADRTVASYFNTLEEYRAAINEHMPEYDRWLRMGPMRPVQKPVIAQFIDFIEGRSTGALLSPSSPLYPVAGALRSVYEGLRKDIEATFPDMNKNPAHWTGLGGFYEDYYRHMWVSPKSAVDRAFGVGRQGNGASLNRREIPTISEGIDKGLMPKILDPIENTLHYAAGMSRFLAAKKILRDSRDAGYVKYQTHPTDEFPAQLRGMSATLPAGDAGLQFAYAPEGFARSYNNWVGRGIYDWGTGQYGSTYARLQYASNAATAAKLAWWGYHALNIIKEGTVGNLALGLGEISRGDLIDGLRDIGYGATIVPGIVRMARKGAEFQKKWLDLQNNDPVVQLLTEAGIMPVGRTQRYAGTLAMSPDLQTAARGATLIQMLRRRSFGWEMGKEIRAITGNAEEGPAYRAAMTGPRALGFVINQAERALDVINAPMFDWFIPKVKAGAAMAEMEAWYRRNQTATRNEALSVARKIVDSMDDRFGEMNQENLFWPRAIKQMLNVMTVSVGWEYGTLRAFGGGVGDVMRGELNSTRARWLIAFPMVMALTNSLYQWLHGAGTALNSETPMRDLFLPKTGGEYTNRWGTVPERITPPGYEKDLLQWYKMFQQLPDFTRLPGNVADYGMNKLNPFWQSLATLVRSKDAIGHSVPNLPNPPFQSWGLPPAYGNWLRFLGSETNPIVVENLEKMEAGTGVSPAERFFGFRPAGGFFQNEEGAMRGIERHERTMNRQERRRAARERARLGQEPEEE